MFFLSSMPYITRQSERLLNYIKRSSWVHHLAMVCVSLLLPLFIAEMLLRHTTLLDQLDNPAPSYIPEYLKVENRAINAKGYRTSEQFRVSEPIENLRDKLIADEGCKVVVLGDSFVWGAGNELGDRWTDVLEEMIDCHVYPFGLSGWSSLEYFGHYERELKDISFDYLLIGVVSNDPHLRGTFLEHDWSDPMALSEEHHLIDLLGNPKLGKLRKHFVLYDYIDQLVKSYFDTRTPIHGSLDKRPIVAYNYQQWEARFYEEDIYSIWETVLNDFDGIAKHPYAYLITVGGNAPIKKRIFDQIEQTMQEGGYRYYNSFDDVDAMFHHQLRPRNEWANLADGHPGVRQHRLYAQKAKLLLEQMGYRDAAKKPQVKSVDAPNTK